MTTLAQTAVNKKHLLILVLPPEAARQALPLLRCGLYDLGLRGTEVQALPHEGKADLCTILAQFTALPHTAMKLMQQLLRQLQAFQIHQVSWMQLDSGHAAARRDGLAANQDIGHICARPYVQQPALRPYSQHCAARHSQGVPA